MTEIHRQPKKPRPPKPAKLPEGYGQAVELYEKYLYDPAFRGRDPKSNGEFARLSRNLLRVIPATGKIPGANPENGTQEVFGFLRTVENALNNAFTQLRNGVMPVCMQIRGYAADEKPMIWQEHIDGDKNPIICLLNCRDNVLIAYIVTL